ncbi:MAG: hypothetical protein GY832_00075 [Chloroflexi bacterium]|nr:hypothetical protein [Chloroflexota bacterium]
MKKLVRIATVVTIVALALASAVSAQSGIPGSGWWSGEMVQNVGTDTAHVVVTAYDGGLSYSTVDTEIEQDAAQNFTPSTFTDMPDGFQGAAVVQADQPIKAVVNVTNRLSGDLGVTGGEAAAQYQGIDGSAVDTTLYFPMAKNDRFSKTTAFYIQNAGSDAATATCVFATGTDTYTFTTPSIPVNEMVVVVPGDAGVPSVNTDRGNIGSLTVTSAENLAGVVMEYITDESPAKVLQATRGFTANDFDTKIYAPTVKQARYNRFTGIQVQNVSGSPVTVTLTLVGSRGDCAGETYVRTETDLASGASWTANQIAGQGGAMVDNCAASASVEATGDVVAVVSESYIGTYTGQQKSTTYSAFGDGSTTTQIAVPMYKENRFSKYTGLMIQNVGAVTATNVIVTFNQAANGTGTFTTDPQTIGPGGSIELSNVSGKAIWNGDAAPSNATFGISVSADQNVVAISNEAVHPDVTTLDQDNNNYEGFNLTP